MLFLLINRATRHAASVCDHIMKIKFLILMFIILLLDIDLVHNSYV